LYGALIVIASTQPDFQHAYPKLKMISFIDNNTMPRGRGNLYMRFVMDSILFPLNFFQGIFSDRPDGVLQASTAYFRWLPFIARSILVNHWENVSLHFRRTCPRSDRYRTKSILGGLMVHLGIAYLMECGT